MRALALFLVFVVGRAVMLAGRELEFNVWAPFAYLWQDLLLVLLFAVFDRLIRRPAVGWSIYGCLALYLAVNVPLVRVLSTPLTPAVVNAASGPLEDSIWHHLTFETALSVTVVVVWAVVIPIVLSRTRFEVSGRAVGFAVAGSVIVVVLGPGAVARVETHGLERNVVFAYLAAVNPRVEAGNSDGDWREPIVSQGTTSELGALRGIAKGRNIVVVALESTGAEYLRAWGAEADPTPNLTALAGNALVFESAYAVYPESIKGLFSVLCSQFPAVDTRAEDYEGLPVSSLPDVLQNEGYRTALFHSGRFDYLGMREMLRGRGFELMSDAGDIGGRHESSFGIDEPSAVTEMLSWIDGLGPGERFLIHYLPVAGHHPYLHPGRGPFGGASEVDRYRNALHYGDAALGVFLEGLRERGLFEKTCFVIYGDHGEAFGQHEANYGHTLFIYEENVHVPMLIAVPGAIEGAQRVVRTASLIDIGPTICDLAGIQIPGDFRGSSLLSGEERMALFYTDYSLALLGLRDGPWKFIYELETGRARLYDLAVDPGETRNLAESVPMLTQAYTKRVRAWAESQRGWIEELMVRAAKRTEAIR